MKKKVKPRLRAVVKFNLMKKSSNDQKQTSLESEKNSLEKRKKYWEQVSFKKKSFNLDYRKHGQ